MNALSGILFFIAFLPYIWAIISGNIQPSPVTWVIWSTVDTLALLAMRKEKAKTGQLTGAVIGAWVITTLAIIYGKLGIQLVDYIAIAGTLAGIGLWKIKGGVYAIVCAQAVVFIGSFPTFFNAYANPAQEDAVAWSIWTVSCLCALCTIKKWNLVNTLQPLTFTTIEITMIFLVVIRPLFC